MYYIYKIINPNIPDEIKYIGYTHDINERYVRHLRIANSKKSQTDFYKWMQYLHDNNIIPTIEIIDEIDTESKKEAIKLEEFYIRLYLWYGHPLTNMMFTWEQYCKDHPHKYLTKRKSKIKKLTINLKKIKVKKLTIKKNNIPPNDIIPIPYKRKSPGLAELRKRIKEKYTPV